MIEQRTRVPIRLFIIRKFTCSMVATRSSLRRTVTCARQTPIDQWTILSTWMNASNFGQSQRVGVVMHVDLALFEWQSHAHDWFFKKFHCTTMHSPNVSLILFYFALLATYHTTTTTDWLQFLFFFDLLLFFTANNFSLTQSLSHKNLFFLIQKCSNNLSLFFFFCIRKNPQKFILFFSKQPQKFPLFKIQKKNTKSCKNFFYNNFYNLHI